jgi:hypothetical protein
MFRVAGPVFAALGNMTVTPSCFVRRVIDHPLTASGSLDRHAGAGYLEDGGLVGARGRSPAVDFIAVVFVPPLLLHLLANVLFWMGVYQP